MKKRRIECYVTDEEYDLINRNKEKAGFTKLAPFIIHCCLEDRNNTVTMQDKLVLNNFLENIRNDKNKNEVDGIFNIFNR